MTEKAPLQILVSNDDGVAALGIDVLETACKGVGEVTVVAPDREQSAASHSLTMFRPLRPIKRNDGRWQVDGTPTDCVVLALEGCSAVQMAARGGDEHQSPAIRKLAEHIAPAIRGARREGSGHRG